MRVFLKRVKNFFIYIAVITIIKILTLMPLNIVEAILNLFARIALYLPIRENKIARKNLLMFYSEREANHIHKKMYLHWAKSLTEIIAVAFKKMDIEKFAILSEESKKVLNQALSKNKGVIFFTAHLGNWELMAMSIAKSGYDTNTIAKESYDPRFTELIRKVRESNGVKCIFRKEEDILGKIKRVISRNAIMGFLIDQNTKVPSVNVKFLGIDAPTPVLPVKILKETGATLLVGYNHRINGVIQTEVKKVEYSLCEDDTEILMRVNGIISEEIKRFPYEWIWIHNRWNITC